MKRISMNRSLCNQCGICEFVCKIVKGTARITVQKVGEANGFVAVCQHCEEPACESACLKGIIEKTKEGPVIRNTEGCIGCGACAIFCPTGAVVKDHEVDKYVTCDLCGGDPLCVKFCPMKAIAYEEEAETSRRRREAYAEHTFAAKTAETFDPSQIDWAAIEKAVKEALS